MTALVVETWPIGRLREYPGNPRKNAEQVTRMAEVIQTFGFRIPIVAKSDGEIVDGHLRYRAAKALGIRDVPVALADNLSPAEVKAFRLLANRSTSWAEWDDAMLRTEILDLKAADFDLSLTGFDSDELAMLLGGGSLGSGEGDAPAEFTAEIATLNVRCRAEHVEALTLTLERAISRAAIPDVEIAPAPPPKPRRKR